MSIAANISNPSRDTNCVLAIARGTWAFGDQILLSAANFTTMVLLARGLSTGEFGLFALIFSVLMFASNVQGGLFTQPHNVLGTSRHGRDYARYTSSTAFCQILFASVAAFVSFIIWVVARLLEWQSSACLLALVPLLIMWPLQEFCRRALYTKDRVAAAFANNAVTCGSRTIAIGVLWWYSALTGPIALYVIAASAVLGVILGVFQLGKHWVSDISLTDIRDNWNYGKWLVATEFVGYWMSTQVFIYMAAGVIGAIAVGVLKTADLLFAPARIIASVFNTILPIRFARTLETEGTTAVRRHMIFVLCVIAPLLGGYCLLVALFASDLMWLLFGAKYVPFAPVVSWYAIYALISFLSMIIAAALRATRLTRQLFINRLIASAIALPIGWGLIQFWGLYGAVFGMLLTYAMSSLLFWRSLRKHFRAGTDTQEDNDHKRRAIGTLQVLTGTIETDLWQFEWIGSGGQGDTLKARRRDAQAIWQEHDELVIKLYRYGVPECEHAMKCEFEGLEKLDASINGAEIDDWMIRTPVPILLCDEMSSIVVTRVPGEVLHTLLHSASNETNEMIHEAAAVITNVMRRFWSATGEIYGDFHMESILCDPSTRTLSFIDPGAPFRFWQGSSVENRWFPASRDLGYLLYVVSTTNVLVSLTRPRGAQRLRKLVEEIVFEFVKDIDTNEERQELQLELSRCADLHLNRLETDWTLRGLWRRIVKRRGLASIEASIERAFRLTNASTSDDACSIDSCRSYEGECKT